MTESKRCHHYFEVKFQLLTYTTYTITYLSTARIYSLKKHSLHFISSITNKHSPLISRILMTKIIFHLNNNNVNII